MPTIGQEPIIPEHIQSLPDFKAAKCRAGAGWFRAKIIKLSAGGDPQKVATKLLKRFKENKLDAKILRWLTPDQIQAFRQKAQAQNVETSKLFAKALGCAVKRSHSQEKIKALMEAEQRAELKTLADDPNYLKEMLHNDLKGMRIWIQDVAMDTNYDIDLLGLYRQPSFSQEIANIAENLANEVANANTPTTRKDLLKKFDHILRLNELILQTVRDNNRWAKENPETHNAIKNTVEETGKKIISDVLKEALINGSYSRFEVILPQKSKNRKITYS